MRLSYRRQNGTQKQSIYKTKQKKNVKTQNPPRKIDGSFLCFHPWLYSPIPLLVYLCLLSPPLLFGFLKIDLKRISKKLKNMRQSFKTKSIVLNNFYKNILRNSVLSQNNIGIPMQHHFLLMPFKQDEPFHFLRRLISLKNGVIIIKAKKLRISKNLKQAKYPLERLLQKSLNLLGTYIA